MHDVLKKKAESSSESSSEESSSEESSSEESSDDEATKKKAAEAKKQEEQKKTEEAEAKKKEAEKKPVVCTELISWSLVANDIPRECTIVVYIINITCNALKIILTTFCILLLNKKYNDNCGHY